MLKKPTTLRGPGISDPELLRPRVLRYLVELCDETPPLGERYEELLRELVLEAYQHANGDLGENEPVFLDEIFEVEIKKVPEADQVMVQWRNSSTTPKSARSWSTVPARYLLKRMAS